MILFGYLTRLFALRWLAALAAFVALAGILDMVDNADRVLARTGGLADLGRYGWLRLPIIAEAAMPFAALVGATATFLGLARHGEIVALRAAGVSLFRLLVLMTPLALALGGLHLALGDRIAPRSEAALRTWLADNELEKPAKDGGKRRWLRSGPTLVSFAEESEGARSLAGLLIYERDATGRLTARISAERAFWDGGAWRLEGVIVSRREGGAFRATRAAEAGWQTPLTPEDLLDLARPTQHVSLARVERMLAGDQAGANSRAYYETRKHELRALVLAPALLLLLAAPVAVATARYRAVWQSLGIALGLGLTFLLINGMARALGESGVLAPALAAWAPTAFFALLGASVVLHVEG